MGIEYLNSAAVAAGFAMVSEDSSDETDLAYAPSQSLTAGALQEKDTSAVLLPAVIDPSRASSSSIGARVTGLLDAWRSKG